MRSRNRETRRAQLLLLGAVVLMSSTNVASEPTAEPRSFTSPSRGYVLEYPSTWHVLQRSLPTLYIVNFPLSERVHAVTLPPGGASIAVVPASAGTVTAEQWAARDLKPGINRLSETKVILKRRSTGAPLDITEVDQTRGRAGSEFEEVNCYFAVSGHLFAGRLMYWKGDAKAARYRQTLHEVIESVRLSGE